MLSTFSVSSSRISPKVALNGGEVFYGPTFHAIHPKVGVAVDVTCVFECGKLHGFAPNLVDRLVMIILSRLSAKICYGSEHDILQKGALLPIDSHKSTKEQS